MNNFYGDLFSETVDEALKAPVIYWRHLKFKIGKVLGRDRKAS